MIKFFRKIRQKLLSENKLGKYLIYAIGEIFLVVIGILIALQLNNLNEERKEHNLELKTLSEIQKAFKGDLKDLKFNFNLHEQGLIACEKLISAFDQDLPYHDSINQYFAQFSNFSLLIRNTSAYETLKTRGVDIIRNDSLRSQIINMHDYHYHYILEGQNNDHLDMEENKRIYFEQMKDWKFFESAKPINYNAISQNRKFRNKLEYTIQVRKASCNIYRNAIVACKSVLKNIEIEIENLKR